MLQEGQPIPILSGINQHGESVVLKAKNGRKLVLFFYPKDDTPGCTAEACNLRDNYALLTQKGFDILGISTDSEKSHQQFIANKNLPFPLLADTDKKLVEAFGVWGEKKFMGRTYSGTHRVTFVINDTGMIEKRIDKVETKNHAQQILNLYS